MPARRSRDEYVRLNMARFHRSECEQRDAADPLAPIRDRFVIPAHVIYLDGNSLGPMPVGAAAAMKRVTEQEWGERLIRGWNESGWMDAPLRLGRALAAALGARADEVIVADSTSINLFQLLVAALQLRPDRSTIVAADDDFPSDRYLVDSAAGLLRRRVERIDPADAIARIGRDTAVVVFSHVHYRSGLMLDMAAITRAAHAQGALALWDLSHSAGAVDLDLDGADVDFAIGCTYKYLNGGPGAPAFSFVHHRFHATMATPLTGWLGHDDPFAFEATYRPAPGVRRLQVGTPHILSMAALEAALEAVADVDWGLVRAKAMALTELFIELVESRLSGAGFVLASPEDPHRRGAHVSFEHRHGFEIVKALMARGVIGDFRVPDTCRFGFSPLITRYVDVWDAVAHLVCVIENEEWRDPAHAVRSFVT